MVVKSWLQAMAEKEGWAKSTVQRIRATIMSIMNSALRDGVVATNPLAGRLRISFGRPSERRLPPSNETARALLRELKTRMESGAVEPWIHLATLLAAVTGIRRGELFALGRQNYDPSQHSLAVNQAVCPVRYRIKSETKTRDARLFVLPKEIAAELERYIATLPSETPHLFPSPVNPALPRNSCQGAKTIHNTYEDCGFPEITLHRWRHFTVSSLVRNGYTFEQIRLVSGHKSRAAFEGYSHASLCQSAEALEKHVASFLPVIGLSNPTDLSPRDQKTHALDTYI